MSPKALIILAEGFEELEAVAAIDILRRAKVDLTIAGLKDGFVKSCREVSIIPDIVLDNLDTEKFDMLILPGGQPGTSNLAADARVKRILQDLNKTNVYIAAICAAPYVLSEAGILIDRDVTSYPAMQSQLKAKKILKNKNVVIDKNVITSQGPGTAIQFALTLVALLKDQKTADSISKAMLVPK